jgi:AsmA-like protein
MKYKIALWIGIAFIGTLVTLTILAAAASRTEPLRKLVVATLEDRLESDVELESFSVDTFPRVVIAGSGLVIRLRNDKLPPNVPPLIQIKSFTVHCGLADLLRRPRRFKRVVLEGLVINIPPGGLKKDKGQNPISGALSDEDAKIIKKATNPKHPEEAPIVVDELVADGALLRIIPRKEGKLPKEFAIHTLTMQSLGFAQAMPFKATLTNPIPQGEIDTEGTFGPWQKDDPSTTPVSGKYSFDHADLNTIKGISGILSSKGKFDGELERIRVNGDTHTPDFSIDISGQPVSLETTFQAVVDGTDGDTYLTNVDAKFLKTSLTAKGAVVGTKGVKGRTVKLDIRVHEGRIEDLLHLATKAKTPLMVGRVALHSDFLLPPGEPEVMERLQLAGQFDLDAAKFTSTEVQQKLKGMSMRARGLDPQEDKAGNVVSNMDGRFRLRNGTLWLEPVSFEMPGATVQLTGSYGLRTQALSFDGTLRMQATISQAAGGGVKGFFLKAVDPIFRKKGAGALIPIRVGGTVDQPKFGLDVGKVFK